MNSGNASDVLNRSARRIKVAMVTKGALMGGGEHHALTLLEGLKTQPVQICLVLFSRGQLAREAEKLGIEVLVFNKRFRGDVYPLKQLIRLIRARQIDIVHTHLISGNLYGRLAGRLARVKGIVTTLHHSDKDAVGKFAFPLMQNLFFHGDNFMGHFSHCLISPSRNLKQLVVKYRIRPSKIVTIPNAINMEKLRCPAASIKVCRDSLGISSGKKVVGMVGRLVSVKNFELYIRAAKKVIELGGDAKFLIIGSGPLGPELEKMVCRMGMEDHILFTGFRDDVFTLVAMMDLFVLCSKSETNPIALMEAMALAKPVIATDVGGVGELVEHGRNGLLCPSDKVDDLAELMMEIFEQPDRAALLAQNAKETIARRYALEQVVQRLMAVYRQWGEKK